MKVQTRTQLGVITSVQHSYRQIQNIDTIYDKRV